jgi:hypothetical protein
MRSARKCLVSCSCAFAAVISLGCSLGGCASVEKLSAKSPFRMKPAAVPRGPVTASSTKAAPVTTVGFAKVVEAAEPLDADIEVVAVDPAQTESMLVQSQPTSGVPKQPDNQPATATESFPIDLSSALRLAAGQNPQIGYAQQRIQEANANVQSADRMWLPSMRIGGNYHKHEGRIQDVAGTIIETSRGSIYTGLGAQAVGAGSPAVPGLLMNFHLTDAHFQPLIAQQRLCARRHASAAVRNNLLLETATAYTHLLEALQLLAVAEQTLASAEKLRDITNDFAETGEGLRADADRAIAELSMRQVDHLRAGRRSRCLSAIESIAQPRCDSDVGTD